MANPPERHRLVHARSQRIHRPPDQPRGPRQGPFLGGSLQIPSTPGRRRDPRLYDRSAVRDDKRGAIPTHIQPIFQRMGLNQDEWLEMVQHFGRRYRLAAGAVEQLQRFGQRLGRYWLQGMGASRRFYQQPVPAQ